MRNFEEVAAKSDELLDISIDELYQIMNNDLLNIKDEALAWEGILRWIKYNAEQRIQHVPLLLTTVRLGILQFQVSWRNKRTRNCSPILTKSLQYFMENVRNHVYVKHNKEAYPIIYEVLSFLEDMNSVSMREYQVHFNCVS